MPNTPGHCSYDRVSKTKSTDKVNALDNPHVVLLLCDGGPSLTREEAAGFALLVARSRILADLSVISVYVSVVVPLRAFCASIINDRQPTDRDLARRRAYWCRPNARFRLAPNG